MIIYLTKMTTCALLFYVIYILLFEKENMHRFKRIYLLISLVFAMAVPFAAITVNFPQIPANTGLFSEIETNMSVEERPAITSVNYFAPIMSAYIVITLLFLFRLLRNCWQMLARGRKNTCMVYHGAKMALMNEKTVPYSFGQYIFINKGDYNNGLIPDEILLHELAHIRQRHTWDVAFIELLIAFNWFNPVFYLYRNKIRQNHEFLADDAVIGKNKCYVSAYQAILINRIPQKTNLNFTSNFNFLITKKRLIMMTKTTSKKRAWCSSMALIPVFMVAICFFSTKTIAQHNLNALLVESNESMDISTQDSISIARYQEYCQIIENHRSVGKDGKKALNLSSFSKADLERMKALFLSMSTEQQAVLELTFQRRPVPVEQVPTKEQFESWKDPAQFGLWLNGKKTDNLALNRYQSSDFSHFFVSRLMRNAKDYGKYIYHLDIETTAYFKERKAKAEADKTLYLLPNRR